ncbi:hypothetical protein N9Q05_00345 [bacterium]|nr:hypothetical protein [bacterium]
MLLSVSGLANAAPLTPWHEPKEDSFYVCYTERHIHYSIRAPLNTYRKYKYTGCSIARIPCKARCVKKVNCPPVKLHLFDWFNNYPQALNAFYRCAYS